MVQGGSQKRLTCLWVRMVLIWVEAWWWGYAAGWTLSSWRWWWGQQSACQTGWGAGSSAVGPDTVKQTLNYSETNTKPQWSKHWTTVKQKLNFSETLNSETKTAHQWNTQHQWNTTTMKQTVKHTQQQWNKPWTTVKQTLNNNGWQISGMGNASPKYTWNNQNNTRKRKE